MRRRVVRRFFGSILGIVLILILAGGSTAQRHAPRFPSPPAPSDSEQEPKAKRHPLARMNFLEMERESKELSQLAGSIPGDVGLLKKGLLPKDVVDKLKRIEKLSKHLRGEIVF